MFDHILMVVTACCFASCTASRLVVLMRLSMIVVIVVPACLTSVIGVVVSHDGTLRTELLRTFVRVRLARTKVVSMLTTGQRPRRVALIELMHALRLIRLFWVLVHCVEVVLARIWRIKGRSVVVKHGFVLIVGLIWTVLEKKRLIIIWPVIYCHAGVVVSYGY